MQPLQEIKCIRKKKEALGGRASGVILAPDEEPPLDLPLLLCNSKYVGEYSFFFGVGGVLIRGG